MEKIKKSGEISENNIDLHPVDSRLHWENCWQDPNHHTCAITEIIRLQNEQKLLSNQIIQLANDVNRFSDAGGKLAEAASRVINNFDGIHRLALAVADWMTAVANEGGR
jgi:hypothetical protein